MCFFKRKNEENEMSVLEDRELILLSSQEIDVLIAMSKDEDIKEKLLNIKDQLQYLSPYKNPKVTKIDEGIKQKIEDIKIRLVKDENSSCEIIDKEIDMINIWIKERNAKELR